MKVYASLRASGKSAMTTIAFYRFSGLKTGGFGLNAFRLALGTVAGQVLTLLSAPVVTRLFSPESFGILAVYLSLSTILAEVASLRYDAALMITEDPDETLNLASLCVLLSLLSSLLLLGVATSVSGTGLAESIGLTKAVWALYLVPAAAFILSMQNILRLWWISQERLGVASLSGFLQCLFDNGTKMIAGVSGIVGSFGLALGQLVGVTVAVIFLLTRFSRFTGGGVPWKRIKGAKMWSSAQRFCTFPLYSSWSSLIHAVTLQVPVLMLGYLFGVEVAGYYLLASRILKVPSRFLGQAVSQSLLKEVAEKRRNGTSVSPLVIAVLGSLTALICLPMGVLLLWGDFLFARIFGAPWAISGVYARIMAPWIAVQFLAYSVSTVFMSLERNRILSLLQSLLLLCTALPFGISSWLDHNPLETLSLLSAFNFLGFSIYTSFALIIAGQHDRLSEQGKSKRR